MLSFGSASMLWWGLAAVIPFVLHLWNRKPRQIVPFAATRFLVAATRRQSRRIKFQQWLLLLSRVAILLLFALALSEPRWGSSVSTIQGALPTHHLLVIDDSYSMAAKIDSEARIDLAKARLSELVQSAPVGDLFSLVAMGPPPVTLMAGPSHDREEVVRAIEAVEIRQVGARVAPAISVVRRLIEDGQAIEHSPRAYRVTIASDLARNSWGDVTPEQIESELTSAAPGCSWALFASGDGAVSNNLAIIDFSAIAYPAYLGQEVSGEIIIGNTGAKAVEKAMVEILSGDRVLFQTDISLAANQQHSLPWRIPAQRAPLLLAARVDTDDLEIDNRRYLDIDVRPAPRILCVASSAEAARHVVMALTSGPLELRPRVDVISDIFSVDSVALGQRKFNEYDAIVLLNLPPLSGAFAQELKSFVENGGGVLMGLGDRAATSDGEIAQSSDFYPAHLGPVVKLDSPRIDPLNYVHPLVAAFRDAPEVGLLSAPIWRYHKLERLQAQAKIAMKFGNGDPALVEESFGRGKVVLFAGSLGAESIDNSESPVTPWSGLPGSAVYVPLIREWVMYCAATAPEAAHFVDDSIVSALGEGAQGTEYSTGAGWQEIASGISAFPRAGFFRAEGHSPIAVNIDSKESWFNSERERFAAWIDARAPEAPPATVSAPRTAVSLSAWLLIPLALLICGELLLATWMRHSKFSQTPGRPSP